MSTELDKSVAEWWRGRLEAGVSLENNPEQEMEFRFERHFWCRKVAEDAACISYQRFCQQQGREPVAYETFKASFAVLVKNTSDFRPWTLRRKDRVTGEYTVRAKSSVEGVILYALDTLDGCRKKFETITGEHPSWPPPQDVERERREALGGFSGDMSLALWWWWKLRKGETVPYYGDWQTIEWNRMPGLESLIDSHLSFCEWRGLQVSSVAMDRFNDSFDSIEECSFRRELAALLPGRHVIPFMGTFVLPAQKRRKEKRHLGDRIESFLCLFLPPLDECRAAFEQRTGIGPQDWGDAEEQLFDEEPDYVGVTQWWRWKLQEGVSVPDETSPFGLDDRFWNRTPSRDMLAQSYGNFRKNQARAALKTDELVSALLPLLRRPCQIHDKKVLAPLFRREPGSPPDSTPRLELAPCLRLPALEDARALFGAALGLPPQEWPTEPSGSMRSKAAAMEPRRVFLLWWHRALSRAGVLLDGAIDGELPRLSDIWPLHGSWGHMRDDYRDFCLARNAVPGTDHDFLRWVGEVLPDGPEKDPDGLAARASNTSLADCRAAFENAAGRKIDWPEFSRTVQEDDWAGGRGGIFLEESLLREEEKSCLLP